MVKVVGEVVWLLSKSGVMVFWVMLGIMYVVLAKEAYEWSNKIERRIGSLVIIKNGAMISGSAGEEDIDVAEALWRLHRTSMTGYLLAFIGALVTGLLCFIPNIGEVIERFV